jgi:integrase
VGSAAAASHEVTYGAAVVRCSLRGDGLWMARWRQGGQGRSTTSTTEEGILKLARKKAKELGGAVGGKVVSHLDAEILAEVKRLAGSRVPLVWLHEVEDCQRRLLGKVSLKQVVDFYEQTGMLQVVRVPFAEARERFLKGYEKKWATWSSYRKALQGFEQGQGQGLMVCDVTKEMLGPWLKGKAPSTATWNKLVGYWRTFLSWAREEKMLPAGEKHAAELLKVEKEGDRIPKIFTPEQAAKALEVLPETLVPAFVVGCWLGPRPDAELRKLRWMDLDWECRYLHVRYEAAGKTARERYVPIPANVVAMLQGAGMRARPEGRLSTHQHTRRISQVLREKGVIEKWVPDIMRHSFISYMLALGYGAGQVAEWAGNSEKEIKAHYRKPLRKEDGEAWFAVVRAYDADAIAFAEERAEREGGRRGGLVRGRSGDAEMGRRGEG